MERNPARIYRLQFLVTEGLLSTFRKLGFYQCPQPLRGQRFVRHFAAVEKDGWRAVNTNRISSLSIQSDSPSNHLPFDIVLKSICR